MKRAGIPVENQQGWPLWNEVPIALFRISAAGDVVQTNSHFNKILSLQRGRGRTIRNFQNFFRHPDQYRRLMHDLIKEKEVSGRDVELYDANRDTVRVLLSMRLRSSNNPCAEGWLEDANIQRAEDLLRLKSSLLANLTHEFRSPLGTVISFAEILRRKLEGEDRTYAELIEKNGTRLLETLDAVLTLAEIESGYANAHPESVDVQIILSELAALYQPLAEEKGLKLSYKSHPLPIMARLDPNHLMRILHNLLSNAIKFTDEGHVSIELTSDSERVFISVCDSGVGIEPSFLPKMFEEFSQESNGLTRKYGGTGLGLSIVQKLLSQNDGSISAESVKGRGSVFSISVPRALAVVAET